MDLFDKRLLFVVGKGGAGKSTLTAAIGLAAARTGKKTLLVEVGEADAIGHIFGKGALPHEPLEISPGIRGTRINPKSVLEEYIHKHIGFQFIANTITRASLFEHLADATPGLKDIMTLGQIWRFEKKTDSSDEHRYDMIVVDAPATGHGLSLLKQPGTLIDMLRFGPIANQTREVQNLLGNRQKTGIVLATLPEELPVNEAIEFMNRADEELGMPVDRTVVNKVYEAVFSDRERETVLQMAETDDSGEIKSAQTQIRHRDIQQAHIRRIRERMPEAMLEIPFRFTNALSLDEIGEIGALLAGNFHSQGVGNC